MQYKDKLTAKQIKKSKKEEKKKDKTLRDRMRSKIFEQNNK
jgi:hypothetical protein